MYSFILLALLLEKASGSLLRGWHNASLLEAPPTNSLTKRRLSGGTFEPLTCNSGLGAATCSMWTSVFPNVKGNYQVKMIVPCGNCIIMDVPEKNLTLAGGLDIQGKLVFPSGYKLTLKAPFIRVQGELQMRSSKIPNGEPDVTFRLTGTDEQVTKFIPHDNNVNTCNGECKVGKKPIVVAGGKLDIEALPPNTPTWVKLHDVVTASSAETLLPQDDDSDKSPPVMDGCDSDGIYIHEDFSGPAGSYFVPSLGTDVLYADSRLLVHRTSSRHILHVDLKDLRKCLQSNRIYLLTVRFRLTKPGAMYTECAETGTGCFRIRSEWMGENASQKLKSVIDERRAHGNKYGEWITFAGEMKFSNDELNPSNIYQAFRLDGIAAGVDIEFDHFELRLPPAPPSSNVCSNLVPASNEVMYHPFPFRSRDDANVVVAVKNDPSDSDPYFAITGRSHDKDGITWDVAPGCIKQDAVYRFQAHIRVHDSADHIPVVWLKGSSDGSPSTYTKLVCPPSNSWTLCDLTLTVPSSTVAGNPSRYEMYLEFEGAPSIDYDIKQISFTYSGASAGLVVSSSVKDRWGPGASILITSHTINFDDEQVRTITAVRDHTDPAYVVLELDQTFVRPTTETDNENYAVEVALLSRNVVFEGEKDDPNELHGAHLMIFHTPKISQKLEGVEFRNFGQQGNLGRYPIHFHMCGDVTGSAVSKNLIRESNQRCIVIHRSHNLVVDGNVAYDTFGHCFMTEDGNEKGNVFSRNLGSLTHNAMVVIPDNGTNGEETDDSAATFWLTNPSNSLVGNVAAGSESNGFWLELRDRVRGPNAEEFADIRPKEEPLALFSNNVAHSNRDKGIRTYPQGFMPEEQAVFYNSRSYRNRGDGLFFQNSRNLAVVGGIFADNRKQLDFDRAEEIEFRDASVICVSDEYRSLQTTQGVSSICSSYDSVVGLQLHTFTRSTKDKGARIRNITMSGMVDTGCSRSVAISFDDELRRGSFDYFISLSEIKIVDAGTILIDACGAEDAGVSDLYLTDLDSSFSGTAFSGTSTIIGRIGSMNSFIDTSACSTSNVLSCSMYCEGLCLRTVTFTVDPANTETYKLKVCAVDSDVCDTIDGTYYYDTEDTELETLMEKTRSDRFRYFAVTLPRGVYTAVFQDNGADTWPSFVEETYEDALCSDSLEEGSIILQIPEPSQCDDLIRNGNAEASLTEPIHWLHRKGGITLNTTDARNGNGALADIQRTDSGYDAISQFLDTRCLGAKKGSLYEINAWVKLVNPVSGETFHCDENTEQCPEVGIVAYSSVNVKSWSKEPIAQTVVSSSDRDYQLVHGLFRINDEMANASSVLFYIERNKKDLAMLVDDVSMVIVPQSGDNRCDDFFYNSNFLDGDTRFWSENESGNQVAIYSPGIGGSNDFALNTFKTPQTFLKTGCFQLNERYVLTAKFKLLDSNGNEFVCDIEKPTGDTECPSMRLKTYFQDEESVKTVAHTIGIPADNEWNTMYGIFVADELYTSAEKIRLTFSDIPNNKNLVVDDISIQPLPVDCQELILNTDMEEGHARFWDEYGNPKGTFQNVAGQNSPTAIKYSNRARTYHGPEYEAGEFMDYRCLVPDSTWEVTAELKLTVTNSGIETGASCRLDAVTSAEACPSVKIVMYNAPDSVIWETKLNGYVTSWDPSAFNLFRAQFTVPTAVTELYEVKVIVRDFEATLDVTINAFSIRKV